MIKETPLMTQYREMKVKHPDAIILFRVGDFYETFSQDAIDCSGILGITLTRRANGNANSVELAGFPHHALDTYLPRLVRSGRRVAICEPLVDPKLEKKRMIKEIGSPSKEKTTDYSRLISSLMAFLDSVNILFILKKICEQIKEMSQLSISIGISPKRAFEAFSEPIVQPSLFD